MPGQNPDCSPHTTGLLPLHHCSCPSGWQTLTVGVKPEILPESTRATVIDPVITGPRDFFFSPAFGTSCFSGTGKVGSIGMLLSTRAVCLGRSALLMGMALPECEPAALPRLLLPQVLCALGGRPESAQCSYTWRGTAPGELALLGCHTDRAH